MQASPLVWLCAALLSIAVLSSMCAEWVAPHRPFDVETLDLMDALLPPAWLDQGVGGHVLGTDAQGRDVFSSLLFGMRISLVIAAASVLLSVTLGVGLGLLAGYVGGVVDVLVMRLCDVMLSFPPILVALMIDGVARAVWPAADGALAFGVLIAAISLTGWVPYARTVRASARIERQKDYVQAARLVGVSPWRIMATHVLPNAMGPVLVLATLQVGTAILIEATLSFLGVGVPSATPSLGSLIRLGNELLLSGDWWVALFPGIALVLVVVCINVVGDALRDTSNPKLR